MRHLFALCLLLVALPALANDHFPAGPRGEAMSMLAGYEEKLTALLDAVPAGSMDWRPGEGVRSFVEVFAHIADANMGIPSLLGIAAPEGWSRENRYEGRSQSPEELTTALVASFAHVNASILGMSDETIGEEVTWFGGSKITRRAALFFMVKHIAEHEGQLVAYARVNGIVPPWSE